MKNITIPVQVEISIYDFLVGLDECSYAEHTSFLEYIAIEYIEKYSHKENIKEKLDHINKHIAEALEELN